MSVNKVILIGRLGRDPEVRYMSNNEPVANFSIATSENWKAKDGTRQERTEWHNITFYRRLAEIAGQYLKKGSLVYIEGRIQSRKYQGKDGVERTAYDIIGNEMKMLGGRNEESTGYSPEPQADYNQSPTPQAIPQPPRQAQVQNKAPEPMSDLEDDIPF